MSSVRDYTYRLYFPNRKGRTNFKSYLDKGHSDLSNYSFELYFILDFCMHEQT